MNLIVDSFVTHLYRFIRIVWICKGKPFSGIVIAPSYSKVGLKKLMTSLTRIYGTVDVCTRWRGTALHLGLQLKLIWLSLVMGYSVDIFTTLTKRILWGYNLDFIGYIYMYVCVWSAIWYDLGLSGKCVFKWPSNPSNNRNGDWSLDGTRVMTPVSWDIFAPELWI